MQLPALLLSVLVLCTSVSAADEPAPALPLPLPLPLPGCWSPAVDGGPSLDLQTDGTFAFQGESGRFMTQGSEIWLLMDGEPRMGSKWQVALDATSLTLSKPEDFKYLGGSEYLYLQLTPTDTVWRFSPTADEQVEPCRRAAKESLTP